MLNKEERDQSTAAELPLDTNKQNLVLYTLYMPPKKTTLLQDETK